MGKFQEKIYAKSPNLIQNTLVSLFNLIEYKKRYGHNYWAFRKAYKKNNKLSLLQLQQIQQQKYAEFIQYAMAHSPYYHRVFKPIKNVEQLSTIAKLPIINKEILRQNLNEIYTIKKEDGMISKTGGTTGKSLEVIYTKEDVQERFAILDNFRNNFGYTLGKKTAWFSGKNLLTASDLKKNRFWKTDYWNKVRYYSTFHMHNKYLAYYLKDLIHYQPKYMVGFPSTMYEIAKYGIANGIDFPTNTIKAIFPTAETITEDIRQVLESYFKTNLYNQYASSEGAPFILECKNKKLHLELQSGVFEVLDENNLPTENGRLVVTAFNTHGTPLIRYDIGDEIELSEESCTCGNNNPLVQQILGRISDYIYSEEVGKINLGNISNCLKGVHGIMKFQIEQNKLDKLVVRIVKDDQIYDNGANEIIFKNNLRDRVGTKINIELLYVKEIPVEKSGKFRLVKNSLKIN
ncbi:phenylacetate--CoA ligase family protein [Cellulophaga sp. Hel_I_12]|uniref:phenylacetate--CoA ligase family protein n=1 Tax=Cellulophaga sp. Hel_I_12 TaxID=1249972 RepID=UPI0006479CCC|nr:phenylacetate--CoA ligase family protein [Cellulophaga sp. Hel_I_12]